MSFPTKLFFRLQKTGKRTINKRYSAEERRDLPTVDRDVYCLGERGSDAILRRASVSPFRLLADGYYGQRPVGELMKGEAHR